MEESKQSVFQKIADFIKKYYWCLAIGAAVLALIFLFLPILKYEIREAIYDSATDERLVKNDYVYAANIIWFFKCGGKLSYLLLVTIGFILIGIILIPFSKFNKDILVLSGIIFLLAVCTFFIIREVFLDEENAVMKITPIVGAEYDSATQYFYPYLHEVSLSWGTNLAIFFCTLAFAFTTLSNQSATTKQIAEEGVLLALAFVLNLVKIPIGATGGSINFQMLPLMIIALRHGPAHGFILCGIVYGLLTCLTDGYGFACYPFDYLIGFGSVALMGFFRKLIFSENQEGYNVKGLIFIFIAGVLSTFVRYIGSNVSSIVVYDYSLKAALAYNAFYIPLSGLIATVAFMLLYAPLIRINKLYPVKSI